MRRGAPGGYQFFADAHGEGQVGLAAAMQVPKLVPVAAKFDAAKAM